MYPTLIINHALFPDWIRDKILPVYQWYRDERLRIKHTDKMLSNTYKLVLNGVSGKLDQPVSWLYDPECALKLRLNGQLIALWLIDALADQGIHTFMANTDGITVEFASHDEDKMKSIVKTTEELFNCSFEGVEYEWMLIESVSAYLAKYKGGVKEKGRFLTTNDLGKSLSPVIIPTAIRELLVNGKSIEDTIYSQTSILPFLMSQQLTKGWTLLYNDKPIQKRSRWFWSTKGKPLRKVHDTEYIDDRYKTPTKQQQAWIDKLPPEATEFSKTIKVAGEQKTLQFIKNINTWYRYEPAHEENRTGSPTKELVRIANDIRRGSLLATVDFDKYIGEAHARLNSCGLQQCIAVKPINNE